MFSSPDLSYVACLFFIALKIVVYAGVFRMPEKNWDLFFEFLEYIFMAIF